jgi:hypothetical protein
MTRRVPAAPMGQVHRMFEARKGCRYLTRTGRMARLERIEPCQSGDDILHFVYLGLDDKPDSKALREGFAMQERIAAKLMMRVD